MSSMCNIRDMCDFVSENGREWAKTQKSVFEVKNIHLPDIFFSKTF